MIQTDYNAIINSPIGKLGIKTDNGYLQFVDYLSDEIAVQQADGELSAQVVQQLQAYFENPAFEFDIACDMTGTDFQQRVWKQLKSISSGHSMTYAEVADSLHSGARAVGGACRKNPIPIIVPCHRVVAKSGIGGYDGDWGEGKVNIKQWLLRHESVI